MNLSKSACARTLTGAFFLAAIFLGVGGFTSHAQAATISHFVWTEQTSSPSGNWADTAISASGTDLAAVQNGGELYVSTSSGATWSAPSGLVNATSSQSWVSVDMSSNGQVIVAAVAGGSLYSSRDGGSTWTLANLGNGSTTSNFSSVSVTADGTKMVAASLGGYIYTSSNSGQTWTDQASAHGIAWKAAAYSGDGSHIFAVQNGGQIYVSTNDGGSLTQISNVSSVPWTDMAVSNSGTYAFLASDGNVTFYTDDTGNTRGFGSDNYKDITSLGMSGDGNDIIMAAYGDNVQVSRDGGSTWDSETIPPNSQDEWSATDLSPNGTYAVLASADGHIYTGQFETEDTDLTLVGSSSATTTVNIALPITDLQVSGASDLTTPVKLLVSNGTLALGTTNGLTFTGGQSGSTIYFSGTVANVNAALATLTYTSSNVGTDTLEVSLVDPGEVFFPGNGHLYEYVSDTETWTAAEPKARALTEYGATGYLTTITSPAEENFVSARLTDAGWMGANDLTLKHTWAWVEGPETGDIFWQGLGSSGSAQNGAYTDWNNGEPNDSGGNEDCAQFLAGGSGKWNDLPCTGTTLPGYVVEFGGTSTNSLPTVTAKDVALDIQSNPPPTVTLDPTLNGRRVGSAAVTLAASSTDQGTVLGVRFLVNGVSLGSEIATTTSLHNYSTTWNPTGLSEGVYTISAVARDNFGDYATDTASVTVDHTAPVLTQVTPIPSTVNGDSATYYYSASFPVGEQDSVFVSACGNGAQILASQASSTVPNSIIISGLIQGDSYQCNLYYVDQAGNTSNSLTIGPFARSTTAAAHVSTGITSGGQHSLQDLIDMGLVSQSTLAALGIKNATPASASITVSTSSYPLLVLGTRDLKIGMTGSDVKALQRYLNLEGFTVAASGSGSLGDETTYFGSATKAALALFQKTHGIAPAVGYFGSITRAYIAAHF